MPPVIIPAYAAVLAVLFVILSFRVIRARRGERVALGDGGNDRVRRAMRVHGNFAEYVPFALLLAAFVELQGFSPLFVHALGVVLVAGRLVHAYGVSRPPENFRFRVIGMSATFGVLLAAAAALLLSAAGAV